MGSRGLPRSKALTLILLAASFVGVLGCRGEARESPSPTATATETVEPTPTATPDLLGPRPDSPEAAVAGLTRILAETPGDSCPEQLKQRWEAMCAAGDLDGDGRPDSAYLVPFKPKVVAEPNPAVVLVRRSSGMGLERLPGDLGVDASIFGRALFGVVDRTGDGGLEVVFLTNECSARACTSRVWVLHWDGTTWRDLGPDRGIDNIDRAAFEGQGAKSVLTIHGGRLSGPGAGPSRAATSVYVFEAGRYQVKSVTPDPPEYLYHAILDADEKFDAADWPGAIASYRAALESKVLKDWREESGKGDGRTFLSAYALFRIAVATAASNEKPEAAFDAVIITAKEEVFVNAALAFRRGFQERGGVHPGCVDATTYLSDPVAAALIRDQFDYGYANYPTKSFKDICPL